MHVFKLISCCCWGANGSRASTQSLTVSENDDTESDAWKEVCFIEVKVQLNGVSVTTETNSSEAAFTQKSSKQ